MAGPIKSVLYFLISLLGLNAGSALAQGVLCSTVEGESERPGSEGCIDVLAWSWGLSNAGSGAGAGGTASFQSFSFSKNVDLASEDMFRLVTTQADIGGVVEYREFRSCAAGCSATEPYLTIRMRGASGGNGATIESLATGGSAGNSPGIESVALIYDEISYCYRSDSKGNPECFAFSKVSNKIISPF